MSDLELHVEKAKAIAMINALMKSASEDNSIISVHDDAHVAIANDMVAKGLMESYPENCTTDPNERCYKVTEDGKQYVAERFTKK